MPITLINNKLVYFAHVPRCGGTAVEHYLRDRFGKLGLVDPTFQSLPEEKRALHMPPQHLTTTALAQLFPAGFFDATFAIVRHPVDRLASVFAFQKDIEKQIPPNMAFSEWVNTLHLREGEYSNHTLPMVRLVPKDAIIFKLEEGFESVISWLDELSGDIFDIKTIPERNSLTQRRWHAKLLTDVGDPSISPDTLAKLQELYAEDFEYFGYTPTENSYREA